jgi:hypothetical protein
MVTNQSSSCLAEATLSAIGVLRSLDKAAATRQLQRVIDVAAFLTGPQAQC